MTTNSDKTSGQLIFEAARSAVRKGNGLASLVKQAVTGKDYVALIEAATINDGTKDKAERRAVKVRMTQELRRQSKDEDTGKYLAVIKDGKVFTVVEKTAVTADDAKKAEAYAKWLTEHGYNVSKAGGDE